MTLSAADRRALAELAITAATEAGELIAATRPATVEHKAGAPSLASQVVSEVDRASEAHIVAHLRPTLEGNEVALLTEEQPDDGGRLRAPYFWCVDPLDGTLPFIEGRAGYAVSIALVGRDGTPWIGVVYDPVESTLVHAIAGEGLFRDGQPWVPASNDAEVLAVYADRSLLAGDDADTILGALHAAAHDSGLDGIDLRTGAGAVMNALGVLDNQPGCYLKLPAGRGGGSLWDFAATACMFHEAGSVATDVHGGALDLNRPDSTFMNHRGVLFASDERLARRLTRRR